MKNARKLVSLLIVIVCLGMLFTACKQEQKEQWEIDGTTPLADIRVRQAIRYAINIEEIINSLFDGKAQVAKCMVPLEFWQPDDLISYEYNPTKAKQLLKEANWPKDYTLDVVYYYTDQLTVDLMTVIQKYLSDVGMKMEFRLLEGDLAAQLWAVPADKKNGPGIVKWDMAYAAAGVSNVSQFFNTYSNSSSLPQVDRINELQPLWTDPDLDVRVSSIKEVEKILNENCYNFPLYHQVAFVYKSTNLDTKGYAIGNDQYTYDNGILDWTTSRSNKTLYTNGGPLQMYESVFGNTGLFMYQDVLFDRLLTADAEMNAQVGKGLATSLDVSDDYKHYTFTLRDDVKWHDGEAFTGKDVKFTFEKASAASAVKSDYVYISENLEGYKAFVDGEADEISGIVVDGNKVIFNFEKPYAFSDYTFSQVPILPEHLLSDMDPNAPQKHSFWQHPIGTGAFKVKETVLGQYSILERNNEYFKNGTGNIEEIYMYASNDNDANLVKNAKAGRIDYAWDKSTETAGAMEGIGNMRVEQANILYTRLFFFNQFKHERFNK